MLVSNVFFTHSQPVQLNIRASPNYLNYFAVLFKGSSVINIYILCGEREMKVLGFFFFFFFPAKTVTWVLGSAV